MAKKSRTTSANSPSGNAPAGATPAQNSAQQRTRAEHIERRERRPEAVRQRKDDRLKTFEKNKRQAMWTKIGFGALALLVLIGAGWWGYGRWQGYQVSKDVSTYFGVGDFSGLHEEGDILYEEVPPVGGPHNTVWQNCGYYNLPINNWNGVHALEHGAVWVTYDPSLPQSDIDKLKDLTKQTYVLVSPYPGLPHPVIASVWGKQIILDGVDDSRLKTFLNKYRQNPGNTPERGALCSLGTSATTDVLPQTAPYVQADASAPPIGGVTVPQATATAEALAGAAGTPAPEATTTPIVGPAVITSPVASPGASPAASSAASPES